MNSMLVPALEGLEESSAPQPFAVYRPTPARWDEYTVTARAFDGFRLFVLAGGSTTQTVFIVGDDGALLYVEHADQESRSVTLPTSPGPRLEQLQAALAQLR